MNKHGGVDRAGVFPLFCCGGGIIVLPAQFQVNCQRTVHLLTVGIHPYTQGDASGKRISRMLLAL